MSTLSLFQDIIRSPDEVKVVLDAALVTENLEDTQNRRVLAVVSHKDDWDLTEEGCLFICKYKVGASGGVDELDMQRVFPIYGQFSVVMRQMGRGPVNLRSDMVPKSVLQQPGAVIALSITPAEGFQDDSPLLTFFTHDVKGLGTLVSECRRLKEASDVDANAAIDLASSKTHFSWLKPYFEKNATIAALTSVPQDLRLINQPLLDRLSPSCAGLPGDDHADAQIIKDDWIRRKARTMCRVGKRKLKLRLGTFNVNGKMPSQDLSAWVQGNVNGLRSTKLEKETPELPPMMNISPLSLGEVISNPFNRIFPKKSSPHQTEWDVNQYAIRVDLDNPEDPDLLVLGFQELDLSTEALLYSTGTAREDAWCLAVLAALGEKAVNYEKLVSKQLVGMLLVIFVKKSLQSCFSNIRTCYAGAGILGVMGNKGGTAVRLTFTPPYDDSKSPITSPGSTSLTFVNAHLAAFDEMVDKRNSDFLDLSKRLSFDGFEPLRSSSPVSDTDAGDDRTVVEIPQTPAIGAPLPLSIYETDSLFWMLDLNYRVDVPDTSLRKMLRDEEWPNDTKIEALTRFDQLRKSIRDKKAFHGFKEMPIKHLPTYRFSPGLAMDAMGYDLKRKPAWTDRVLYMHDPLCRVEQLSYTSHPQITMSDHRPVSADFEVDMDIYDTAALNANARKLLNDMHELELENTSGREGLKIQDTYVDFEKISYGTSAERKLSVRNTSKSPCAFRFVPVQIDSPIHPEWLSVHPLTGILLPDEVITITLSVQIDKDIAAILNTRPKDLSATLILHTMMAKDHFISVSGEYQYTCFANKLARLTRLRGAIRAMQSPDDLLPETNAINAPREIMRLVNWMMAHNEHVDGMFLSPANDSQVHIIRECLDTGEAFPFKEQTPDPQIPIAFAATLIAFLNSLTESIIPATLHQRCLDMTNRDEAFELLDELSPAAVNVWISITAFLHFICQRSKEKDLAERIATVLAPVLLRDDSNSFVPPISPLRKKKFLLYFIS
ncbi:DNase I-like protein [Pholiota conissans]|uniref:DNase I-like protein n=1 Tax=Pholiota conissans TaxID=109636 RepID=A0A9P5ZBX1_9AGAR|nr:DNase I-like protein [Pholiota conissans]